MWDLIMNRYTETFKSLGDISPISSSFSKINIKLNECMHAQINKCIKPKDVMLPLINSMMPVKSLYLSTYNYSSIKWGNYMGSYARISSNSNILWFHIIIYVTYTILVNIGNVSTNDLEVET